MTAWSWCTNMECAQNCQGVGTMGIWLVSAGLGDSTMTFSFCLPVNLSLQVRWCLVKTWFVVVAVSKVWEGGTGYMNTVPYIKVVLCTGRWREVWVQLPIVFPNLWSLVAVGLGSYLLGRDNSVSTLAWWRCALSDGRFCFCSVWGV